MSDPRPIRVVFLTAELALAGAERQVVEVASRLRARGIETSIVSLFEPTAYVQQLHDAGVAVTTARMRRGRPRLRDLARVAMILRAVPSDVLVSFTFPANLIGRLLGRMSAPAIVTSLRSTRFGSRHRERLLSLTDRVTWANVVNSQRVGAELVARGVVSRERLRVIPNGIDLEAWDIRLSKGARQATDRFTWLAVGRLEPAKDYPTLLEACAILRDRGLQFHLRIVGDGRLRQRIETRIKERNLGSLVTLEGLREDVSGYMARADAFVLSSEWEGSPNALMEAMASRLPAVATDVGGVRELIGVAPGALVESRNPRALADAMGVLMARPVEDRNAVGREMRTQVETRHDFRVVIEEWERLLRDARVERSVRRGADAR